MTEYRLKGLSCPDCAADLERSLQQLPYGDTAKISYGSGTLQVDERADLKQVKSALSKDGVTLVPPASSDDGRDQDQDHSDIGRNLKIGLITATALYLLALLLEGTVNQGLLIGFYLAAMAISGYKTFRKGVINLVRFRFTIDTLMTVALIGAIAIGEWKEGTLVAILFGLNEYLEGLGMERARRSLEKLMQVAPRQATLITASGERVVPIQELKADDLVLVRPGEKIPSDGVVATGRSSVNEAAITGESLPTEKLAGEKVFGGSINNEGVLRIRIEKAYENSTISRILQLVKEAQNAKTPTEQFINRFARYYTPLIMALAALVMTVPPLFTGAAWGSWIYQGLAVLIVGCPCALILSSPVANLAGITRNARNGVLVKGSAHLEQLGRLRSIAFDKTGTLTKGRPHVEEMVQYHSDFLKIAGAIEKNSSHPLAQAVIEKVKAEGVPLLEAEALDTLVGQGVTAVIDGKEYWAGNERALSHLTFPAEVERDINRLKEKGFTLVLIADDEKVLGLFGLADEIRVESIEVIGALHAAGITETVMLTGDHPRTAEKVAKAIGITTVHASLLPEDKVAHVKALTAQGKTAMVGDGINDSPALASADLGIAMGKGTDSAIEIADVVLMQDHLGKLPAAIRIARRVNKIIRLNITLALGLKLLALLLTIPGWLTLWIAILSDMGATILVTVISLSILWQRKQTKTTTTALF
ncbi:heavy metal translocating P-type ATPase [Desmospora activa]|uniref:Cd(2+)-exporting ATPase n=1 Tax=Desmospora activa DSM 45169 TaxID=1121389 RepID=A0A2T4Z6R7_9BACL|nr:heavy metal translocating P-type ATPase [Desmospora activa]PTM57570.1 Cd2+/Zn2+-exporting ATPase [Desmospora activa DSM 45169]